MGTIATGTLQGTCRSLHLTSRVMTECYFDIAVGGQPQGRICFKLYSDVVPKTAEKFLVSCAKVVISQEEMVLVAKAFMETNSLMRTSRSSTPNQVSSLWQMLAPIQMDHSFSSQLKKLHGWMANMLFLVR